MDRRSASSSSRTTRARSPASRIPMTRPVPHTRPQRDELDMQLVSSRMIPFLDSETLATRQAREALFRAADDRFVLYLADGDCSSTGEERVMFLDLREALIWLNEPAEQHGSFWT